MPYHIHAKCRTRLFATAAIGSLWLAQPAFAQQDAAARSGAVVPAKPVPHPSESVVQSPDVAEVVVTARGKVERLETTPVAASVLSGIEVDRVGNSVSSLSILVPSLRVSRSGAGTGGSVALRGVATSISNAGLEQKVALNIDGVQVSRARILTQGFFDTKSIEILKGPQALFFGKNATAGVVSIQSNDPARTEEGYMRAGYEIVAHEYMGEGAYSIPISDDFRIRIALRYSNIQKGYLKNDTPPVFFPSPVNAFTQIGDGNVPKNEGILGRITLVYQPSDRFDANLKITLGDYSTHGSKDAPPQVVCKPGASNMGTVGITGIPGPPQPYDDCKLNNHIVQATIPSIMAVGWPQSKDGLGYSKLRSSLTALLLTYRLPNITITSTTGYADFVTDEWGDSAGSAYPYALGGTDERFLQYSEELRAATIFDGPINFTFGALAERTTRKNLNNGLTFPQFGPDPRNGFTATYVNLIKSHGETLSAFAQATWKFLPDWELAGGARYSRDQREAVEGYTLLNKNFTDANPKNLLPEGVKIGNKVTFDNVSPEVTLSWKPRDGTMLYFGYRQAQLPGGVSATANIPFTATKAGLVFQPETAKGFEGGVKFRAFDSRLRGDITLYRFEYDNLQVSAFDPVTFSYQLSNVGSARAQGVEFDLNYRIDDSISFRANANYNDTKFLSFHDVQCYSGQVAATGCITGKQDLTGRPFPRAPKVAISASAIYDRPLLGDWNLGITTDVRYNSSYNYIETQNPVAFQKAFATLDMSARIHNETWDAAIIGRNLTNVFYALSGTDQARGLNSQVYAIVARPREVVLQLTKRF